VSCPPGCAKTFDQPTAIGSVVHENHRSLGSALKGHIDWSSGMRDDHVGLAFYDLGDISTDALESLPGKR